MTASAQSGIMVNYLYDHDSIEDNHEAFVRNGTVVRSGDVDALLHKAAAQALLAVGDRVEDRGVGALGLCPRRVCVDTLRQQRRHGGRQSLDQRDLDEDQWLAGKRGVKEGEAAAVGRKATPQIGPALDLVHRLIGD